MIIPNIWKNRKRSKLPTSIYIYNIYNHDIIWPIYAPWGPHLQVSGMRRSILYPEPRCNAAKLYLGSTGPPRRRTWFITRQDWWYIYINPLVIKGGNGQFPITNGFQRDIIYKIVIFLACHVWLPESIYSILELDVLKQLISQGHHRSSTQPLKESLQELVGWKKKKWEFTLQTYPKPGGIPLVIKYSLLWKLISL